MRQPIPNLSNYTLCVVAHRRLYQERITSGLVKANGQGFPDGIQVGVSQMVPVEAWTFIPNGKECNPIVYR